MAPADALRQDNILDLAVRAIQPAGDRQPSLKTQYEAVALIGHACMVAVDFRLVGLSEDHNLEPSTDTPSLPAEWNANDTFAFRYAHVQSSMQYLLKVSRLGNNAVIFALALGDDRTSSFDLPVKDYISTSALPLSSSENLTASLRDVFISPARLGDLVGLFKINVIQKLAPGLYKEGGSAPAAPTHQTLHRPGSRMSLRSTGLHEDIQEDSEAGTRTTLENEISTQQDLVLMILCVDLWVLALVQVAGVCILPLMTLSSAAEELVMVDMTLVYPQVQDMIP
ncbi:Proteasome Inhibitor PI31 [Penicillium expansum]|nr:Proteasome Inhibitor PI31 [Penicillium expansum]